MFGEAQRPSGPHPALLLLGLVLGTAARLTCVGDAYPKDGRCCRDCPPGEWPGHRIGGGCLWVHGDLRHGGGGHRDGRHMGLGVGERGTCRWGPGTRGSWAGGLRLIEWVTCNRAQDRGPPGPGLGVPGHAELGPPPAAGYGMESRCSRGQDTKCHPCLSGFYNEATNYEPCKPCTQCNQSEHHPSPDPGTPTRVPVAPPRHSQEVPTAAETNPKPQWGLLHHGGPLGAPPSSQGS